MKRASSFALMTLYAWSCTSGPTVVAVPSPPHDVVALLAHPDTRTVGHVVVSSRVGGSVELTTERAGTRIAARRLPSVPFTLSEAQVQQVFGDAFVARPPAPRHFLLYFETGSNHLTPESQQLVTEMLAFVTSRSVPDVTVVGHTDTTGAARDNIDLGQSRAAMIRDHLVATGLDAGLVSVASHGEADLLVSTPDETPEPRNRRVQVSVR